MKQQNVSALRTVSKLYKTKSSDCVRPQFTTPNERDQFVLSTNASLTGIGADLSQKTENRGNSYFLC